MQKPIGGYFEWEFPKTRNFNLHENALLVNSGRHALEYILRGIGDIKKLWIPYFTCDVIFQPLVKLGIPYSFYNINSLLQLNSKIELSNDEYILYTNYYGIMDAYVHELSSIYGNHLIIDNAQALFCKAETKSHQIYSPRKFIGMPDGGIVVSPLPDTTSILPIDMSFNRCSHLLKRMELLPSEGYADFKTNSKKISEAPLGRMSPISKNILTSVKLESIKKIRQANFSFLHSKLISKNIMKIPMTDSIACPLVYPFWSENSEIKKHLISKKYFCGNLLTKCS